MFPLLAEKPGARTEAYLKLWKELFRFAQLHSSSYEHRQVIGVMERMWPEASKGDFHYPFLIIANVEVETQPMDIEKESETKPVKTQTPFGLYAKVKTQPDSSDYWSQMKVAQRKVEEDEWKKSDATQRPVEEMKVEPHTKKLKKDMVFEQELEKYDHSSLFYLYWSKHKANPPEFDGRLQDPTFYSSQP